MRKRNCEAALISVVGGPYSRKMYGRRDHAVSVTSS